MTARDWTALAFRLTGIFLLLVTLTQIPSFIVTAQNTEMWGSLNGMTFMSWVTMISGMFLPAVIGLMLLRRTDWFVDRAFASVLKTRDQQDQERENSLERVDPKESADQEAPLHTDVMTTTAAGTMVPADDEWVTDFTEIRRDDIQAIAFSLMGVWILSSALPEAASYLTEFFRDRPYDYASDFTAMFISREAYGLAFVVTRVALGLWLFLSSYSITRLWSRQQEKPLGITE